MKQLTKIEELIGKTIENIIIPREFYDDMWIKFTDSSYVVITEKTNYNGFDFEKTYNVIDDHPKDNTCAELVELGLITNEEHELALKQQEEEYEKWRKDKDLQLAKEQELRERKLLEEFKNKYK